MNPYTLEGKKTDRFEIAEQLSWQVAGCGSGQRRRWQYHQRRAQRVPRSAGAGLDRPHAALDRRAGVWQRGVL